jgi:3D-(3,5/4)-trihydroxycyclohexane-1,2-dione acylhydrolase (decyclizing)
MKTRRMTMAQALIEFLKQQHVERDGREHAFFAGMVGIFGHGNVAGIGQALQQNPDFPYILVRNEQAGVHMAAGFAKATNRLRTFACTSSIGPGATNMITGAALATINRLPVLLLPGDIFTRRNVAPVLQQLESTATQDTGVNDCFKPVSRYWDRIYRPEQLITSLPEAMRVLTSPADCGAVTLALPQDVQTEAYEYPEELFRKRVWLIRRGEPDRESLGRAVKAIRAAGRPLIVCGGGVLMSEASQTLGDFAAKTGLPVAETQAGKGALAWDQRQVVGAIGATGSLAANRLACKADLVIGIGTRYSDFTTASMTAFQNPNVKFVNINAAEFDAYKVGAIPVVADARVALERIGEVLGAHKVSAAYAAEIAGLKGKWDAEVDRLFHFGGQVSVGARAGGDARTTAGETPALQGASLLGLGGASSGKGRKPAQSEVIGAMVEAAGERGVLVSAAGSHPGDLHKLWRTRTPNGYHMEYGYSCMGYEIPGAMGAKLADPTREVFVFLGDGTYLMAPSEIATSVQEGIKIVIVLVDNGGFASIGSLSRSLGQGGFGTRYRARDLESGQLDGEPMQVDFVANARSLGAHAVKAGNLGELKSALKEAKTMDRTTVIVVETDVSAGVPDYESWWDVAVAEVSEMESVREARAKYEEARKRERHYL